MDTPAPANTPYASRVLDWSDERKAGDGIIVTLAPGWAFEPSLDERSACHVRGFDTIGAAKAGVSKKAKPCECKRCNPAMVLGETVYCHVDDSTQHATVYDARNTDKPVASLSRRRVFDPAGTPRWRLHDLSGLEIGSGFISPGSAIRALDAIRTA